MWIVPLSEVHVKYFDSTSKERSLICVGVVPRLNSPIYAPVVGLKILIKVPYNHKWIKSDSFAYLLGCSCQHGALCVYRHTSDSILVCLNLQILSLHDLSVDWLRGFFRWALHLSRLCVVLLYEPSQIYASYFFMTRYNAKVFPLRNRMNAFRVLTRCNLREDLNLTHFNAIDHVLLGYNEYTLRVWEWYRIRVKCVYSANKLGSLVVPEMYVVTWILRVKSWCDNKN